MPQRQLFLHRNIRKFKMRNTLRKTPSRETSNSPERLNKGDIVNTDPASSTTTSCTLDTASPNDGIESNADVMSPLEDSTNEINETTPSITINR